MCYGHVVKLCKCVIDKYGALILLLNTFVVCVSLCLAWSVWWKNVIDFAGVPASVLSWSMQHDVNRFPNGSTLRLLSVDLADIGVYSCTPVNKVGSGQSDSISLNVIGELLSYWNACVSCTHTFGLRLTGLLIGSIWSYLRWGQVLNRELVGIVVAAFTRWMSRPSPNSVKALNESSVSSVSCKQIQMALTFLVFSADVHFAIGCELYWWANFVTEDSFVWVI